MTLEDKLKKSIRDVPDFPRPGIMFKDISPVMLDSELSSEIVDNLFSIYKTKQIDAVAGIESRGFLFGYPLAIRLGVPFILIRKEGKLPYQKISHSYELEYGKAVVEMHVDAVSEGQRILVHDDLLATGGSAKAASQLIKKCGGVICGFNFLVSLDFLNGKKVLKKECDNIMSLINY